MLLLGPMPHVTPRKLIPLVALALLAGCADDGEDAAPIPSPDAAVAPAPVETITLRLTDETGGLTPPPTGVVRLIASRDGPERVEHDLGRIDTWPHQATIELPAGAWTLTLYLDRGADGSYDACPFPPDPATTERADDFDNIVGTATRARGALTVDVALERHICGPGDRRTGLSGTLDRPDDPLLDDIPLYARLTPIDAVRIASQGMADAPQTRPLRIPLAPTGAPLGRTPFTLAGLVPGHYRLDIWADHDGDRHPTPCGDGPGGGDRHIATLDDIELTAGEIAPLPDPVTLDAAPCPAALTGVTGRLVPTGEATPGEARIELVPTDGGHPIGAALVDRLDAPRPFVTSGIPAGDYHVHVYLDLDGDDRFSPCGANAGLDAVYRTLEDIHIDDRALTELGDIELRTWCDVGAGLAGQVEIAIEDGPAGSARPVRLALTPVDHDERRTIDLFDAHTTRDGTEGRFARPVPPGRYTARAYVDTDRDGAWRPCPADLFGDRAASRPFEVEVAPGAVTELDAPILVETLDCPLPDVAIDAHLDLTAVIADALSPSAIEITLVESGGWRAAYTAPLDGIPEDGLVEITLDDLAPGTYALTTYVDGDGLAEHDACDTEAPDPYQARLELTLDARQPIATPRLTLVPCRP